MFLGKSETSNAEQKCPAFSKRVCLSDVSNGLLLARDVILECAIARSRIEVFAFKHFNQLQESRSVGTVIVVTSAIIASTVWRICNNHIRSACIPIRSE